MTVVIEPAQWLILRPLLALAPSRRSSMVRAWLRLQARVTLGMARFLGGMSLSVEGAIAPTSSIVVMNHQSILDIPVAVSLVRGPYPLIPTRASYQRGIPGISALIRIARFPAVSRGRAASRAEIDALIAASDQVARGERSLIIFPEGHRSRDGSILPFKLGGLRLIFERARERPVYVVVVDGLWRLRTFAETARNLSGSSARIRILGPYTIPPDSRELDDFIESLRQRMIQTLSGLREKSEPKAAHALPGPCAG